MMGAVSLALQIQSLRPASGNFPEGRPRSCPAPEKSFKQEREERSWEGDQSDQNCQPGELLVRSRKSCPGSDPMDGTRMAVVSEQTEPSLQIRDHAEENPPV